MMMYYCCIEDIFEGIFDSREKCIKAIKERFNTVDWMGEKPSLKRVRENLYEQDGTDSPIIDNIYVKWEDVNKLAVYNIVGCNVNTVYSC